MRLYSDFSSVHLVGCRVSDIHPGLCCVVPEDTHSLTPAVRKKGGRVNLLVRDMCYMSTYLCASMNGMEP